MRNKIFGGIGVIWGAFIIANWLFGQQAANASQAYQSGQIGAVIFGALLLLVGLYYSFKKA